ncbi:MULTISPECIES: hypothetical protein [Streptomyces]|uniref:hypothetical protein n=1 Tax=Streptomyces TaxID=1883 RepID=UPI001413E154|nr:MULTISPECIES: hypothetical protein [Streptomyces]MBZ6205050.1 hypothetical protein [Streptomyces olivaceus]MBZ6298331.1 hypothetical protein [Streptomyces olivaceus]QIP71708.1 hypothetical protein EZV63_19165 [Streptomyces sp. VN1]
MDLRRAGGTPAAREDPAGTECGEPLRAERGVLVLRTGTGEARVPLADATALLPVDTCPGAGSRNG